MDQLIALLVILLLYGITYVSGFRLATHLDGLMGKPERCSIGHKCWPKKENESFFRFSLHCPIRYAFWLTMKEKPYDMIARNRGNIIDGMKAIHTGDNCLIDDLESVLIRLDLENYWYSMSEDECDLQVDLIFSHFPSNI